MKRKPIQERFMDKVEKVRSGCWIWTAFENSFGYGMFGVGSRTDGTRKVILAHRWAYECFVGPIPDGFEVHHTCKVRACVNPEHLVAEPHENHLVYGVLRGLGKRNKAKTHCPKGHPYDVDNTYIDNKRSRVCRTCRMLHQRELRKKRSNQTYEVGAVASL